MALGKEVIHMKKESRTVVYDEESRMVRTVRQEQPLNLNPVNHDRDIRLL